MNQAAPTNYDNVLSIVRQWTMAERYALVQDVLKTLAPESADPALPHVRERTLQRALGLLATQQPAPTDEEVQQWLDEHRMEKYG
jgi:hypothetical protein